MAAPINDPRADQLAFAALSASRPAWTAMMTARDALGLEPYTVLHSGPPAPAGRALVQPTLNSTAVACVFERWADSLAGAFELIRSGRIRFEPAQDRSVATPMAAVVTSSMTLIQMTDLDDEDHVAYAPINGGGTGGSPAPRFGRATAECVAFLRFLNRDLAPVLERACDAPVEWLPIVDHALVNGDDTHLRHDAAHRQLVDLLHRRLGSAFNGTTAGSFIEAWPFFHLNFWMAAIGCAVAAARGVPGASLITAFGGNGDEFGLQVSGLPKRWFTCPATPPLGKLRAPHTPETCVGAYGDSALVEAFGLGALAHAYAPQMQAFHAEFYHADLLELPAKLLLGPHPGLPRSGAWVGLSARRVVGAGATPVVELGIVDRAGRDGGLGAGLYRPPMAPFMEACAALDEQSAPR